MHRRGGQTERNRPHPPRGHALPRALVLLPVLLGALAAGCVSEGAPEQDVAAPIAGSWVHVAAPECSQTLLLEPGGDMTHQVHLALDGGTLTVTVPGSWGGAGAASPAPGEATTLQPHRAAPPHRLLYCHQWLDTPRIDLPFAAIALDTGVDPAALDWRALPVAGLGRLLVGSDTAHHDRFALHLDGDGVLHGFLPDAPAGPPLYHRAPRELVVLDPPGLPHPLLHLPEQFFSATYSGVTSGDILDHRLLRIDTASDVRFGAAPGSGDPACAFVLYEDAAFLTPAAVNWLDAANLADPIALNPADPGQWFLAATITLGADTEPAYVWPVAIVASADGACSADIRARPIVAGRLEAHLALAPPDAPLRLAVGTGPAYVPAARPGLPGGWTAVPLRGPAALPDGLRLQPRLFKPPLAGTASTAALGDMLGLYTAGTTPGYFTLESSGASARLHLFADRGATYGLGPFTPYRPPEPFMDVVPPAALAESFAPGELRRHYRIALAAPARLAFSSSGGLDTAALLRDARGLILGWDAAGAADGAGFHIMRTLTAGTYVLTVWREGANGSFQLNVQAAAPGILSDERLEACLIAAGALRTTADQVRGVACPGRGVTTAAGLEAYTNLTALDLSDNGVQDVTPLAALGKLESLALGHNPVDSLATLAALSNLHRLSLAGLALDATLIAQIAALGDRLTLLELPGATGLTEADAIALKQSMPHTTLVTPAGAVLE